MFCELVTRNAAREVGLKRFFTGEPCRNGHVAERFTTSGQCIDCNLAYKAKDPAKTRRQVAELNKKRRRENPELARRQRREYYLRRRDKEIKSVLAWKAANRGKVAAAEALRRKAAKQATPSWANLPLIQAIYQTAADLSARTGVEHHVDHIYPLQGVAICGLHVHWNLRVITAELNERKGNRVQPLHIVLLNGPPRSGKSTAAKFAKQSLAKAEIIGFSYHLKRMVHGIYMGEKGWDLDPDYYDSCKSEPSDDFFGLAPRHAYIHYSESVIKPLHGKQWFASMFLRSAWQSGAETILVPDSGFREEAERVVREVGAKNTLLVRIHKEGCTYAGDSRTYISLADLGVREVDVENFHGRPEILNNSLLVGLGEWTAGRMRMAA